MLSYLLLVYHSDLCHCVISDFSDIVVDFHARYSQKHHSIIITGVSNGTITGVWELRQKLVRPPGTLVPEGLLF